VSDASKDIGKAKSGSLVVIGSGISVSHLSIEARGWLATAEKVLYCIADAPTERLILKLNPNAESMYRFYGEGKNRAETYREMVDRTLECVRAGQSVCVVYYGHPGIFVNPGHRAIKKAREEGFEARMLPAISSLDCLFCDLGFDPSSGCQMFEATDLLVRQRLIDVYAHVVIWQIASVGDIRYSFSGFKGEYVPQLVRYLEKFYSIDHEVAVYQAAQFNVCEPVIRRVKLTELNTTKLSGIDTLYIPPVEKAPANLSVLEELNLLQGLLDKVELVPIA
jgi:uncharacterized protein YabN with tetrapyrrole methylase and pyrophosphatase domain